MEDKSAPPAYPGQYGNSGGYTQQMPQPSFGGSPYGQTPYPGQGQYPGQPQYGQGGYPGQPTNVIIQPTPTVVVATGGCPNCRVGVVTDDYGCCAIFLAIFFFPIGILCCLAMRERRCTSCGARF